MIDDTGFRAPEPGLPHTLVLGGARSGKSRYAEAIAEASAAEPVYLATAHAGDDEMAARITEHKARRGPRWRTVEAPIALAQAITAEAAPGRVLVVDCLTLWLSNLMLAGHPVGEASEHLLAALAAAPGPVILIGNEVGLGIVPDNALARAFRDHAGRLHQALAARVGTVVLMVAGLPMVIKASDRQTPATPLRWRLTADG